MTRKELETVLKILERIKDPDTKVLQAIALVNKDLAAYDARRGQLRESYDYGDSPW